MSDKTITQVQRQTEPCDIPHADAETTAIQETQAADKGELACSEPERNSLSFRLLSQAHRKTSGSTTSNSTDGGESENDDATKYPKDETRSISPLSSSSENSNSSEQSDIDGDEHVQMAKTPVSAQTVPAQATGSPSDGNAAMIPSSAPKSEKYLAKLLQTYDIVNISSGTCSCTSISDPRQYRSSSSALAPVCIDPADEHRNPCLTMAAAMANRHSSQTICACSQQHSPSGPNAPDHSNCYVCCTATSTVESITDTSCSYLSRDNLCRCISKTSSLSEFTLPILYVGDIKVLCKLHPQGYREDHDNNTMSLTATCHLPQRGNSRSLINKPNCVIQMSTEVYEIGERNKKVVINSAHNCQKLNDEDRRNFTKHMVVHAVASQSYLIFDSVSDKIYFKVTVEIRAG